MLTCLVLGMGIPTIPNNGTPDYHGNGYYEEWNPIKGMGNGAVRTWQSGNYHGF